jgi:hypothetical protein
VIATNGFHVLFEREFIPVFHHRINADDFLNHLLAKHERSRAAAAVEIQCLRAGIVPSTTHIAVLVIATNGFHVLFEGEFIPVFHHRINADDLLNHLVAKHERSRAATAVEIQCLHAGTGLAHRTADGLVFAFAHAKSIIPALLIEVVVTVAGNVLAKGIVRMTGCNVTTIATRPLPVLQTFRGKEAGVAGCEKERVIAPGRGVGTA